MKKIFLVIGIIVLFIIIAFGVFYFWGSSGKLSKEALSEIKTYPETKVEPPANQDVFVVATYNIGYLSGMANNLPVRAEKSLYENNMSLALKFFEEAQADFIGFQEIDFHSNRSYYVNQLEIIAKKTGYDSSAIAVNWDKNYVPFPYWPISIHFGEMLSGQAILSKYPIKSNKLIILEKPKNAPFFYNAFYLDRILQIVEIEIHNKILIIMNVHLEAFDRETREGQAKIVLDTYKKYKDMPVLLIGDFNCLPPRASKKKDFPHEAEEKQDFTNETTIKTILSEPSIKTAVPDKIYNNYEEEKTSFTYSSGNPVAKIDYIFYNSEKIEVVEWYTLSSTSEASDHLPVIAKFKFRD